MNFTKDQQQAIDARNTNILVAAAAGSGKTKVLVERLLDHVADGDSVDEFLVITYTRAAAFELREKILDEITARLATDLENRHLRKQLLRCYGAPIGTIHSFCADILRENAGAAGLAPDFRVADEGESALIRVEVLDGVLDKAYETVETCAGFRALVDLMSAGYDDTRLVSTALDLYAKLQSSPNQADWATEQARRFAAPGVTDASGTPWGKELINNVRDTAEFHLGELLRAREEMREFEDFNKAYGASFDVVICGIEAFLDALDAGWDSARVAAAIDFPRPKPVSGYESFKDIRKRCKSAMEKCAAVFECSSEELFSDMAAVSPAVTALLDLVMDFDRAYLAEKRRRGLVDFSDLEHLTLRLLRDGKTGELTGLAHDIAARYKEIMVDEYQDVNAVQELIIGAVIKGNMFMVGDVKQSIYRFRLADPSIFLSKYKSFGDVGDTPAGAGASVLLSKNFRSRAGILASVNFVFENIMSVKFGEMDYTEREKLLPGRGDTESADSAIELNIIDMKSLASDDDEESPQKIQAEARFIAGRIAAIVNGEFTIPDGQGGERRVEYSDIVILLRSVRDKAGQYAAALTETGIPVERPSDEGFFKTLEISAALSILQVIDNPMQDIPLAAAMQSPAYGFTADDLASIRATQTEKSGFYGALVQAAQTDGETGAKCSAFLTELEEMRALAPDMPADKFIWHVYNQTGLLGSVGALRGGERRRENLMTLVEYASRIERGGYRGLFGFLTYIRGLIEKGADLPLPPDGGADSAKLDAVRIMSIHKSKGLEFPVVILADTSKRVNNLDVLKPIVVHPELGVGPMCRDSARRIEYPTLARLAVQSRLTSELMAEELRVLYVAMTRAREKLIITMTFGDAEREIEKFAKVAQTPVSPQILRDVKSMAGWILLPTLTRPEAATLVGGEAGKPRSGDEWDIRLVNAPAEKGRRAVPLEIETEDVAASPYDVETLKKRFAFAYPHDAATALPSKLTVTELKGRQLDYEAAEEAESRAPAPAGQERDRPRFTFERPDFIVKDLTPAERGTALHLAMQYIDYKKCTSDTGVADELRRIADMGFITEEQAGAVDVGKITRFFESETGRRVLRAESVQREFKFSLLYPAERFYKNGGEDKILLQGVIDCFFEEGGELTVIDFKTDYVTTDTLEEKTRQYAPQIDAYADALERMTGLRVADRVIYFFALDACFFFE